MKFLTDVPLSQFSSYELGGNSRYFFDAKNEDEVRGALQNAREEGIPIFIIGGGTNLLIGDEGFSGLVLRPSIAVLEARGNGEIQVGAGVLMRHLLNFAVEEGLSGLEWAGGLPGTVGGAIRGNAGAFGGEMKDVVYGVRSMNTQTLEHIERSNAECKFGYRTSVFRKSDGREVILEATLALAPGDKKSIRNSVEEKIAYRGERHPMEYPNIGSIFKNIPVAAVPPELLPRFEAAVKTDPFPVVPAAFVISEAGLKGVSFGGALVSPKHPNFIVNALSATAEDVKALIELVKTETDATFGIELEEEIQRLDVAMPQMRRSSPRKKSFQSYPQLSSK